MAKRPAARVAMMAVAAATAMSGMVSTGITAAAAHPDRVAKKQPLNSYELFSNHKTVHTSTDKKVTVEISAEHSKTSYYDGTTTHTIISNEASVTLGVPGGAESHSWQFQLDPGQFTANPKAGTGQIDTETSFGDYGLLKLTIKPAGKLHSTPSCNGKQTSTSRRVRLTGKLFLNTQSKGKHKLGHVGSRSKKNFSLVATLDGSYGSTGGTGCTSKLDCSDGLSMNASDGATHVSMFGSNDKAHAVVSAYRTVDLTSPKDATRSDSVYGQARKLIVRKAGDGSHYVSVIGAGKRLTGSAKLSSTSTPTPEKDQYCKGDVTDTSYFATLISGKKPLRFHETVFGTLKVNQSDEAGFTIIKKQ